MRQLTVESDNGRMRIRNTQRRIERRLREAKRVDETREKEVDDIENPSNSGYQDMECLFCQCVVDLR